MFDIQAGSSRIGILTQPESLNETPSVPEAFSQTLGNKVYEFSNHLGNILTTFSDRKIAIESTSDLGFVEYYTSEILSSSDYYPFGFEMPGRSYSGVKYRYGFQGQEDDPEVYDSESTSIYFKYRIHDTRIGRFLSIDPLAAKFPYNSAYAFSENRVNDGIELEGLEVVSVHGDFRAAYFITASISGGFIMDKQGVALYGTGSLGLGLLAGVSGGAGVTYYGANRMEDLKGWGFAAGVSATASGGVEYTIDFAVNKGSITAGAFSLNWSGGGAIGVFGEGTYTLMSPKLSWSELGHKAYDVLPTELQKSTSPKKLSEMFFQGYKTTAIKNIDENISNIQKKIDVNNTEIGFYEQQMEFARNDTRWDRWTREELVAKYQSKVRDLKQANAQYEEQKSDLNNTKQEINKMTF